MDKLLTPEQRRDEARKGTAGDIGLVLWRWTSDGGGTWHLMGIDQRCTPHYCCLEGYSREWGRDELEEELNRHGAPGHIAGIVCVRCYDPPRAIDGLEEGTA